ncbi:hypothetical protein NMY22_g17740 [Coprinellus aureogranulatus]|nr:hypothetical protein NMY22_g17740 [Coprinellus aureogranulatus]
MKYQADSRFDGSRTITFLFQLTSGLAPESFGIECGRLAGLPEKLLQVAGERSDQMRQEVTARVKRNKTRKAKQLIAQTLAGKVNPKLSLEELKALAASIQNPIGPTPNTY